MKVDVMVKPGSENPRLCQRRHRLFVWVVKDANEVFERAEPIQHVL